MQSSRQTYCHCSSPQAETRPEFIELPEDLAQARRMIAASIQTYHSMRPHLSA
jgi:hypothetical protein